MKPTPAPEPSGVERKHKKAKCQFCGETLTLFEGKWAAYDFHPWVWACPDRPPGTGNRHEPAAEPSVCSESQVLLRENMTHEPNTATDNLRTNQYEMERKPDLLPCPFCGSSNLVLDNLVDEDDYFVSCGGCEIQQIANYTREGAIRRWNQRKL
jgi:Lar family restriction alleviation protein